MVAVSDTAVVGTKDGETLAERMLAVSGTAGVGTKEGETLVERMLAVSGTAGFGTEGGVELTCGRGSDTCAFRVRTLAELPLLWRD